MNIHVPENLLPVIDILSVLDVLLKRTSFLNTLPLILPPDDPMDPPTFSAKCCLGFYYIVDDISS